MANERSVSGLIQHDVAPSAEYATKREHGMTFFQAVQLYYRAVAWGILMSSTLIMDGYDIKLIGSLFAQPQFARTYGVVIGGYTNERFGFRRTMMSGLLLVPCVIFVQYSAWNLPSLELGQCFLGVPLGMFQSATSFYAVEVMPVCFRAHLTAYVNMCWLIGKVIASAVLRGVLTMPAPWAYRVPFAIHITVDPVAYCLVAEIPLSLLRSKSVAVARLSYATLNIAANVWTPYQLNPSAWGWGAKSGFFWAAMCALGFLFTYLYVPETKDRTVAELDLLFEMKIPARGFANTRVDILEIVDEKRA